MFHWAELYLCLFVSPWQQQVSIIHQHSWSGVGPENRSVPFERSVRSFICGMFQTRRPSEGRHCAMETLDLKA